MVGILQFFENTQNLKEKKRRGWLVHGIENSENTAGHIYRVAVMTWVLGSLRRKLNLKKALKMALMHDLCEVFSFDATPYDPLLPKKISSPRDRARVHEILKKWPTFTFQERQKKVTQKHQDETRGLKRLIRPLSSPIKKEIESLWDEFENGLSQEARFVRQVDKIENFLQGMEYWSRYGRVQANLWTRWIKEILDDAVLVELEKAIEKRFFEKNSKKRKTEFDQLVEFFILLGQLKERKRLKWVFRKVPNPETIADHSFGVALASWIFSFFRPEVDQKKLLKMALLHNWSKVFLLENMTGYFILFPNLRSELKKILDNPFAFSLDERRDILERIRKEYKSLSRRTKEKRFRSAFKSEQASFKKLVSLLSPNLQRETQCLWEQFKNGLNKEAVFLKEVDVLENFLQAVKYYREDNDFPIDSWWVEIGEKITDPALLKFVKTVKDKYFESL